MGLTFCIVDDEREVCDVLRLFLEARGHKCHLAYDGRSGLEMIRRIRPSAVFLDLQMPVMNGYEVLHSLRADSATADIPILMMTALTAKTALTTEQAAESSGADLFLHKPFELEELLDAVEKLTGVKA